MRRQLTSALGMLSTLAGQLQVMPDQTFDLLNLSGRYTSQHMVLATSLAHQALPAINPGRQATGLEK